ncbi:MAG: histidine phosphatase family protein [Sphingobium sp.]
MEDGVKPGLPTLYLIRHGETAWSLSGQHTGHTDIPLTAQGEVMARELAPLLDPVPFIQIWTSPRQRARRTCELAAPGRTATIEPDLAEWDYGDYEGLHTADIRKTSPRWSVFRDGCPGGETLDNVVSRADRLLVRLRRAQGNIALFSHGQFGCVLAARWAHLAGREGEHFALDPASLSILGPKPGHPEVPVITRWNIVPLARLDYRNPD